MVLQLPLRYFLSVHSDPTQYIFFHMHDKCIIILVFDLVLVFTIFFFNFNPVFLFTDLLIIYALYLFMVIEI